MMQWVHTSYSWTQKGCWRGSCRSRLAEVKYHRDKQADVVSFCQVMEAASSTGSNIKPSLAAQTYLWGVCL